MTPETPTPTSRRVSAPLSAAAMTLALVAIGTLAYAQAAPAADAPAPAAATAAAADPAVEALVAGVEKRYAAVTDFKATFKQTVRRKHLPRPLVKKGTVFYKRPGMMRWDYASPEPAFYLSDGQVLWSYQPEDALVYKVPVKDSELYGSLKFLFGQGSLTDEFKVSLGEAREGSKALVLQPKVPNPNYKRLVLHVDPSSFAIVASELVDPLDNTSRIEFTSPSYEPLKPEGFKFVVPEGVRVEDLRTRGG